MATYLYTDAKLEVIEKKRFRVSGEMTAKPDDLDFEEQWAKYTPVGKAATHREKLEDQRGDMVFLWLLVEGR